MTNDQKKLTGEYKTAQSAAAIQSLKSLNMEPSPYLARRVLNNLETQQKTTQPSFWSFWRAFSAVALATLFIGFFSYSLINKNSSSNTDVYALGQPYVVRMDIRPLPKTGIAYAEISLPDENIEFSSQKFADLKQQKKLVVNWDALVEKQYLPIIVQGVKPGASRVIVNFYDSENKVVTSREISLYFKKGGV